MYAHNPPFLPPKALLAWYDQAGRSLPWRALPGQASDPYRVWLSEIMLQQTGVETVKRYYARFLAQWPDVIALAKAPEAAVLGAWAGLGYYARARNLIACAQAVAARGGVFPATEAELRALPGIGAYTAAAIAAIAFGQPAVVVDGNIERITTRVFGIRTPLPNARAEIVAALKPLVPPQRPGDFAQAMMDLGALICTPHQPKCPQCPLAAGCLAHKTGMAEHFPYKRAKPPKPVRYGRVYVICNASGAVLLGQRPAKGLLAGMAELPGSGWENAEFPPDAPPLTAEYTALNTRITHVFTHFTLHLSVQSAQVAHPLPPAGLRWVALDALAAEPLPTLFTKVLALALPQTAGFWQGRKGVR